MAEFSMGWGEVARNKEWFYLHLLSYDSSKLRKKDRNSKEKIN